MDNADLENEIAEAQRQLGDDVPRFPPQQQPNQAQPSQGEDQDEKQCEEDAAREMKEIASLDQTVEQWDSSKNIQWVLTASRNSVIDAAIRRLIGFVFDGFCVESYEWFARAVFRDFLVMGFSLVSMVSKEEVSRLNPLTYQLNWKRTVTGVVKCDVFRKTKQDEKKNQRMKQKIVPNTYVLFDQQDPPTENGLASIVHSFHDVETEQQLMHMLFKDNVKKRNRRTFVLTSSAEKTKAHFLKLSEEENYRRELPLDAADGPALLNQQSPYYFFQREEKEQRIGDIEPGIRSRSSLRAVPLSHTPAGMDPFAPDYSLRKLGCGVVTSADREVFHLDIGYNLKRLHDKNPRIRNIPFSKLRTQVLESFGFTTAEETNMVVRQWRRFLTFQFQILGIVCSFGQTEQLQPRPPPPVEKKRTRKFRRRIRHSSSSSSSSSESSE